jgi:hypothetical protein
VGFATAILWLSLHSNVFESETLRTVEKALKETKECCLRASKQPKDAPAYFCRFIDRFGVTFSTALSRRASPVPSQGALPSTHITVPGIVNGYQPTSDTRRHSAAPAVPSSSNVVFPWESITSQPSRPAQGNTAIQTFAGATANAGSEPSIFDIPARQTLIDFFTFDQNYWYVFK